MNGENVFHMSMNMNMSIKKKKTATDLQDLIDNAEEGSVVDLGNFDYVNVSNVNITKNITLKGDGTTITSAGDGSPIFNIVPKSQNGPDDVNITGILFNLQNGDVIVNAIADNATDNNTLDVANINISNNAFSAVDDNVVTESVVILNLQSEKGVLSPNGEISISNNLIEAGTIPFSFDVTSVSSGEGINIVPLNITPEKKATVIEYSDMATTAFDYNVDDRVGEYFRVVLKDSEGNALVNKPVQIGFNGVVYNEKNGLVTDENGSVKLQINLGYKGTYTFAICFLGDYDYNASFVVAKITVNLQKPTLSVPNKSYAASAKTKTLTATFKSSRGNAIAGKKVTFKLNGKTYSATTNANGVAAVNVSLNTKGTYSFTVKFAGSSTYAAVNKSAKLTIK
ncbi:Ig-like domain-containing protein [uncultured Methanobrevibacter sp.]|uniref:Ig-like domain-containing protein n=1 Tax=uncultured Methanobrevibacter sp. TaxID=253161 RepID=UPI0025F3F7F5|nr:Ig-like domain repeat protein [uncultured Methanobrevibacter sp.]